jgi:cytidylate kinase
MKATVVCISHTDGAHGFDIGRAVAERLGFRLADDAIILDAARTEGLLPESVSRAESPKAGRTLEVDFGRFERTEAIRDLIRAAVLRTAAEGAVVIVSHAASYALADQDGVLRVMVTASDEARTSRIAGSIGIDEKKAAKRLGESDKARADYLQRFYGVKHEAPTDYDLVISTDRLTTDEAAAVVAGAAAD